jgi:hypothetical protein
VLSLFGAREWGPRKGKHVEAFWTQVSVLNLVLFAGRKIRRSFSGGESMLVDILSKNRGAVINPDL